MPQFIGAVGQSIDAEGVGISPKDKPRHVLRDGHIVNNTFIGLDALAREVLGSVALINPHFVGLPRED